MYKYKDREVEYRREWSANQYRQRGVWMDELKSRPCDHCGWQGESFCKDWHHRPGETKLFNVGQNRKGRKEKILAEIAKCDLLCAICHRRATHGEALLQRRGTS